MLPGDTKTNEEVLVEIVRRRYGPREMFQNLLSCRAERGISPVFWAREM